MTSLAHSPVNDTRLRDFMTEVRELGRDKAEGDDAFAKLFLRTLRAAADGVVTLDKDNNGEDDARRIFAEFTESREKKLIHERSTDSIKAQASKLRTGIKAGIKNGSRAIEVVERAKVLREEMIKSKLDVKAAYPSFIKVATADYASDTPLTDDQVRECCSRVPAEKDVESELARAETILDNLVVGKNGVQDTDPRIVAALENIRTRKAELQLIREKAALVEKMRELGMPVPGDQTLVPQDAPTDATMPAWMEPAEAEAA